MKWPVDIVSFIVSEIVPDKVSECPRESPRNYHLSPGTTTFHAMRVNTKLNLSLDRDWMSHFSHFARYFTQTLTDVTIWRPTKTFNDSVSSDLRSGTWRKSPINALNNTPDFNNFDFV